ncbi:MAG: PAS domain-containing protein, partial [Rhodospirillaceae bacterium]
MKQRATAVKAASPRQSIDALSAQEILDSAPSAAIVVDRAGRVIALNTLAEELLGEVASDVLGEVAGGAFGLFLERARRDGGLNATFQHYYNQAWYTIAAFPVRNPYADEPWQIVVANDITDSKMAEFEIRESEGRLEEATRIAQLGTYKLFWDTQTAHWSPHMYILHGLTPGSDKIAYAHYRSLVHSSDREAFDVILADQLSGKHIRGAEYRIVRKDGAIRWLRVDG